MTRVLFVALLVWLWPSASSAHTRSVSYSAWQLDAARASVVVRVSALDASALERAGHERRSGALAKRVRDSIRLSAAGAPCAPGEPRERLGDPEWLEVEWSVSCARADELAIDSTLLFVENPSHLHLARVRTGDASATEHVLDANARKVTLSPSAPHGQSFGRFVALGVEHIATGWDHLLLLAMLLVFAKSLRRAAWVVTGFTIGHTVSLSLASLGLVVPQEAPVEALIAVSIGLVAVENVWLTGGRRSTALPAAAVGTVAVAGVAALALGRPVALALLGSALFAGSYFAWMNQIRRPDLGRTAVVALFGLVHGFGFARVLSSMDLEPARLIRALIGFNLGVELAQLAAMMAVWPVLVALRRRVSHPALVPVAASGALCLSCYWLVWRAFGG
ncbi:MAG: HupE/UreJ family protein [Myxococcales bacterium]|nr:HupE/UreJ family protein [Myxococcales bacterium]